MKIPAENNRRRAALNLAEDSADVKRTPCRKVRTPLGYNTSTTFLQELLAVIETFRSLARLSRLSLNPYDVRHSGRR